MLQWQNWGKVEYCLQRLYSPQSLRYLLDSLLQKKFADPCFNGFLEKKKKKNKLYPFLNGSYGQLCSLAVLYKCQAPLSVADKSLEELSFYIFTPAHTWPRAHIWLQPPSCGLPGVIPTAPQLLRCCPSSWFRLACARATGHFRVLFKISVTDSNRACGTFQKQKLPNWAPGQKRALCVQRWRNRIALISLTSGQPQTAWPSKSCMIFILFDTGAPEKKKHWVWHLQRLYMQLLYKKQDSVWRPPRQEWK